MKANAKNKGFTLIELLVVIAIIALLSATIFAALSTARQKARDANRIATARSFKTALALYEDKYGSVIGINGLSANASGTPILVASGTLSIADVLKNEGFLDRKVAGDSVYGTSEYYLGVASDGRYDVYAKLERPESSMTSSTITAGSDGADALAAGYNYASGFGSGVGTSGGGTVASGGGGGGGPITGGIAYVTPGTYTFTVPSGVTSISVVAVGAGGSSSDSESTQYGNTATAGGGGALAYANNKIVASGTQYTVIVGAAQSWNVSGQTSSFGAVLYAGGGGGKNNTGAGGTGSGTWRDGGNNGGVGGYSNGGGGSGGYTSVGGSGGSATYPNVGGSAGGVGIYGGTVGGTGGGQNSGGSGGSGGGAGSGDPRHPGLFGGGAGASNGSAQYGFSPGASGAVRIIWPGDARIFPSTSVASTSETSI